WSKWRQSNAWGKYVARFGLAPVNSPLLPSQGIAGPYESSLAAVVSMFPGKIETKEEASHEWSLTRQAEKRGFPKDMSPGTIAEWKAHLEAELAERRRKVQADATSASGSNDSPGSVAATRPPTVQLSNNATVAARSNVLIRVGTGDG